MEQNIAYFIFIILNFAQDFIDSLLFLRTWMKIKW